MARKDLHPTRLRALERVWQKGLSDAQKRIVDALDGWFDERPDGPTINEIMGMTGLSFGAVWTALPVLEHLGYVIITRDRKGRQRHRGVILMHGFDLSEGANGNET